MAIGTKPDFDVRCFFTPYFTGGFSSGQTWYRPWELANDNITTFPPDTRPQVYQYVPGQQCEPQSPGQDTGLRPEFPHIEISKHLLAGSTAKIVMVTRSDRDIWEISDSEVATGHMIPRMKFPMREWEINLKSKTDASFPNPPLFRGTLLDIPSMTFGDVKDASGDGLWRIEMNFESWDSFRLRNNRWAPLYYHRAQGDSNEYHLAITGAQGFTFNSAITEIVKWMNQSRPTTDFPVTFSYSTKGTAPYTNILRDPEAMAGSLTFTNSSTTVGGNANSDFTKDLTEGSLIRLDSDGTWYKVGTIDAINSLTLTSAFTGITASGNASKLSNEPIITDVWGKSTWEILTEILNYMGALEGLGIKYIPTCSVTGVIDVAFGGFDKTHAVDEDFRALPQSMQKNTSTDMTTRFNMIKVPFTATVDAEYWIKFTLYKSDGAGGWNTVLTIPPPASGYQGYEYVRYEPWLPHSYKYYSFPTQEITPEDTYKWDVDLVTAGSFTVALTGASAYPPPSYSFLNSSSRTDYRKLRTFLITRGLCEKYRGYSNIANGGNLRGCKDGGLIAEGGNGKCVDVENWMACYPDPHVSNASALTGTPKFTLGSATVTDSTPPSGTLFVTELFPGYQIKLNSDGTYYTVKKITSNTSLTLTSNYLGTTGSGASTKREGFHGDYGIISDLDRVLELNTLSNENSWNTLCRLHSKRVYECHLNTGNKIRAPVEFTVVFNQGWTTDLVGSYLEVYCVELDDMIVGRCIEQRHEIDGGELKTTMECFRI